MNIPQLHAAGGLIWLLLVACSSTTSLGASPSAPVMLTVDLSGAPNDVVPGFVPHGDPLVSGTALLTIYANNTMDYQIQLNDDRYRVTQAHLYNIQKTSGTSGNPAHGDSIICWGGRWANGGNSTDFLVGQGYSNRRLREVLENPSDWYLMLHTEGGHFATDAQGHLIPYTGAADQETSVTGVPESERAARFNNRVGRRLDSLVLRADNDRDPAAPFHNPLAPDNQSGDPFPDAQGNLWIQPAGNDRFELTADALAAGYDLTTEYLFYLYDDQGPRWDFGGPEGAMGGFLRPVPEPSTLALLGIVVTFLVMRTKTNPASTHGRSQGRCRGS